MRTGPASSPPSAGAPSSPAPAAPLNVNTAPNGTVNVTTGLQTPAFPAAYADPLTSVGPGGSLQLALDGALNVSAPLVGRVAFCVVALDTGPPFPMAMTANAGGEYYAASLLKVAAMYTLFELRQRLRLIAAELGSSTKAADFLTRAAAHLTPQYNEWARKAKAMSTGISFEHATPRLDQTFACTDGGASVSVDFLTALTAPVTYGPLKPNGGVSLTGGGFLPLMINWSDTTASFNCIRRCGYGTINGMLENANFFSRVDQKGIWLAGDFEEARTDGTFSREKYPVFRIPSDNDGPSAQATTVVQMARLFALMFKGDLYRDAASNGAMRMLLQGDPNDPRPSYQGGPNETWMNRTPQMPDGTPRNYDVLFGKLGVGPSRGQSIFSETSILGHDSGRKFVFSWANFLPDPTAKTDDVMFLPVIQVAHLTLDTYVSSPSTPSPPTQPSPTPP